MMVSAADRQVRLPDFDIISGVWTRCPDWHAGRLCLRSGYATRDERRIHALAVLTQKHTKTHKCTTFPRLFFVPAGTGRKQIKKLRMRTRTKKVWGQKLDSAILEHKGTQRNRKEQLFSPFFLFQPNVGLARKGRGVNLEYEIIR